MSKHRLNVTIEDDEFWQEWNQTISWGLRQHLIIALMKLLVSAVKESHHPGLMIGALISGHYKLVIDHEKVENSSRGVGSDSPLLGPKDEPRAARAPVG